jgi:hypothetical protein
MMVVGPAQARRGGAYLVIAKIASPELMPIKVESGQGGGHAGRRVCPVL